MSTQRNTETQEQKNCPDTHKHTGTYRNTRAQELFQYTQAHRDTGTRCTRAQKNTGTQRHINYPNKHGLHSSFTTTSAPCDAGKALFLWCSPRIAETQPYIDTKFAKLLRETCSKLLPQEGL